MRGDGEAAGAGRDACDAHAALVAPAGRGLGSLLLLERRQLALQLRQPRLQLRLAPRRLHSMSVRHMARLTGLHRNLACMLSTTTSTAVAYSAPEHTCFMAGMGRLVSIPLPFTGDLACSGTAAGASASSGALAPAAPAVDAAAAAVLAFRAALKSAIHSCSGPEHKR